MKEISFDAFYQLYQNDQLSLVDVREVDEFEALHLENIGICLMIGMVALGVGLLIYTAKTKPQYLKKEDMIVEDFKAWQADQGERKNLMKSLSSALWTLTLAVYFILSFSTHAWHITWVIFLIATAAEQLLKACFDLKK